MKKRFWKRKQQRPASDVLEDAVKLHDADYVSVRELMVALEERGFGLLMVIFVLPNCVPVPVPPGVSSLLAIPLLFLSVQMLYGKEVPWLPRWLKRRQIKRSTLASIIAKAAPKLKKIEKLLRARLSFASTPTGEKVIGALCLIFSLSIAVPLPWTNFVPGLGILIMSLGLLSKDGVTIIIGSIVGFIGIAVTTSVLVFGVAIISYLKFW